MLNVWAELWFEPSPSSLSVTVTNAVPKAFGADVQVSVPDDEIAGCAVKSEVLLFDTLKVRP